MSLCWHRRDRAINLATPGGKFPMVAPYMVLSTDKDEYNSAFVALDGITINAMLEALPTPKWPSLTTLEVAKCPLEVSAYSFLMSLMIGAPELSTINAQDASLTGEVTPDIFEHPFWSGSLQLTALLLSQKLAPRRQEVCYQLPLLPRRLLVAHSRLQDLVC